MTTSTEDFKSYILEIIYQRKLAHERELKPLYDQLVRIESLSFPPMIIVDRVIVESVFDTSKNQSNITLLNER